MVTESAIVAMKGFDLMQGSPSSWTWHIWGTTDGQTHQLDLESSNNDDDDYDDDDDDNITITTTTYLIK